ncbi:ABC transporter permease [Siculibacillus lacustris]|uniref:Transport permease protein n=1 Tax=Siculibacillus lacustris TaxID=1549641 RepID=A0A4Q9VY31_9HYPH|nr:ABC transporter permease [Siculibacillus lacustris]TBW41426.1 ABC transporter permease [Siculibacillus lacustris]
MVLRYWYLLSNSWPRAIELVYWPTVQMLTWGFVQLYVAQNSSFFANAAGLFVGGLLLWDVLLRSQQGFAFAFLEELWSRNLGNLLMSPLRPSEFIVALMAISMIRLAIGVIPVTLLAIPMFGYNIWGLGLPLIAFFVNLVMTGWAIGLVIIGILLRQGMGAEALAWSLMFLMMPITCVYYPVATLPAILQPLAWALPPTHVFEGMRAIVIDHSFRLDLMAGAFAMNVLWMIGAVVAFYKLLAGARRAGSLLQQGE